MFKLPMGGLPIVPLQHLWTNGEPDDMTDAFEHVRTERKWFIIISPMIIPYVYPFFPWLIIIFHHFPAFFAIFLPRKPLRYPSAT